MGFNHGYLFAKYTPSLLAKIVKRLTPSNDYFQGFFSGSKEYEIERSKSHLDDLTQLRSKDKSRNLDLEKDR